MTCKNLALQWSDNHRYSPAPRHRRRIVLNLLSGICYRSCLDAGCAQPYLLASLYKAHKRCYGCDISDRIIGINRSLLPYVTFAEVDISKSIFPGQMTFDVVISCEVLEHIDDWRTALKNLVSMARSFILITVPSGKIYPIDEMVGHRRHFDGSELIEELDKCGMRIVAEFLHILFFSNDLFNKGSQLFILAERKG